MCLRKILVLQFRALMQWTHSKTVGLRVPNSKHWRPFGAGRWHERTCQKGRCRSKRWHKHVGLAHRTHTAIQKFQSGFHHMFTMFRLRCESGGASYQSPFWLQLFVGQTISSAPSSAHPNAIPKLLLLIGNSVVSEWWTTLTSNPTLHVGTCWVAKTVFLFGFQASLTWHGFAIGKKESPLHHHRTKCNTITRSSPLTTFGFRAFPLKVSRGAANQALSNHHFNWYLTQ